MAEDPPSTQFADGESYSVTVEHDAEGQTSYVTGGGNGDGSGFIDMADVTDIWVQCWND